MGVRARTGRRFLGEVPLLFEHQDMLEARDLLAHAHAIPLDGSTPRVCTRTFRGRAQRRQRHADGSPASVRKAAPVALAAP